MTICIMKTGKKVPDNKIKYADLGYTLVELMVVIAIIAVVLSATTLSVNLLFSKDAAQVSSKIDDELTEARMLSMSKNEPYEMVFCIDNASSGHNHKILIVKNGNISSPEKVIELSSHVKICVKKGTTTIVDESDTTDLNLKFDKSNGSVTEINGGVPDSAEIYTFDVKAERGTQKESTVRLIPMTGRHNVVKKD